MQIPGSNSDFIDEVYSRSSIDKSSRNAYVLDFDIHINRRNRVLGIRIRLNYLGIDGNSINGFLLNLSSLLSLRGILCLLLGAVPQEMPWLTTKQATSHSIDMIVFLLCKASTS